MKTLKKMLTAALAAVLVCGFTLPVWAEDTAPMVGPQLGTVKPDPMAGADLRIPGKNLSNLIEANPGSVLFMKGEQRITVDSKALEDLAIAEDQVLAVFLEPDGEVRFLLDGKSVALPHESSGGGGDSAVTIADGETPLAGSPVRMDSSLLLLSGVACVAAVFLRFSRQLCARRSAKVAR